jgi:sugar phosphate isomerase/epimerase
MVQIGLTPDARWTISPSALVAATQAVGFSHVGIAAEDVDAHTLATYVSHGTGCHEVLVLNGSDDPRKVSAAADKLAAAAEKMRAFWVPTYFTGPVTADSVAALRRCTAVFAEVGAAVAIEFSPLGPVDTIYAGMELVRAVNSGGARAGLLVDSWHFFFGGSTWDELIDLPLDDIAYVQFSDGIVSQSERGTWRRRAVPGDGILELKRFASTLLDRGWDGIVSVEVLRSDLGALSAEVLAQQLYERTIPYWR